MKIICCLVILTLLAACDNKVDNKKDEEKSPDDLNGFVKQVKSDLVFVNGGSFWMGDFCKKMRDGGPYCTGEGDNKPLHNVELSSYSISKFKITNQQYDYYLKYTHQQRKINDNEYKQRYIDLMAKHPTHPTHPAHANWVDADKYCRWLADVTHLPFSLPTEAQWEYAARSRGEDKIIATDDNTLRVDKSGRGENIATDYDRQAAGEREGIEGLFVTFPGDKYPPNPLGVYDMAGNGFEWTKDWYDPNYYSISPVKNPQGPENPVVKDNKRGGYMKVIRGRDYSNIGSGGITIDRYQKTNISDFPLDTTIRCVVNSPEPIK